jgi:hypothetical protein
VRGLLCVGAIGFVSACNASGPLSDGGLTESGRAPCTFTATGAVVGQWSCDVSVSFKSGKPYWLNIQTNDIVAALMPLATLSARSFTTTDFTWDTSVVLTLPELYVASGGQTGVGTSIDLVLTSVDNEPSMTPFATNTHGSLQAVLTRGGVDGGPPTSVKLSATF